MNKKISVVTICYNDIAALTKTHKSLITQDLSFIEWIVVDGNSNDGTKQFLDNCDVIDKYISESDNGIYDAMNKGTNLASCEFIVYLNAGDIFSEPNILSDLLSQLVDHDVYLLGANFTSSGDLVRYRRPREIQSCWHSVPANHQATIFRTSALGQSPYNCSYKICGDYELIARLYVKKVRSIVIDVPLVSFELGGVSTFNIAKLAAEALMVQKDILGLPFYIRWFSWGRRQLSMCLNLLIFKLKNIAV